MINTVIRYLDAIRDNVKAYKHWFIYEYICWDTEEFKEDLNEIKTKIESKYAVIKSCTKFMIQVIVGIISMFVSWLMLWCLFRG